MARPFWSGHLQISLVSFGIQLFPATEAKSEIRFHQLSRKTGERIRHRNVSGDEQPIEKDEIVKGYEYTKGEYVKIEPEDIENLRIPSRQTLEVAQFVDRDQVGAQFYEKPYFVTPENSAQAEAFAVVRKAMQVSGKVALGKIAFGGREHLLCVMAPEDDSQLGMMAYTLRYAEELRDPAQYFENIKRVSIDEDQLSLAQELIKRKTTAFKPEMFTDDYEAALRAMVEAKVKHAPAAQHAPASKPSNVVNLMDALRKSVQAGQETKSSAAKSSAKPPKSVAAAGKLSLVTAAATKAGKPSRKQKSA